MPGTVTVERCPSASNVRVALRPAGDDETSVREPTSNAEVKLLPLTVIECVQLWALSGFRESVRLTDLEWVTFNVRPAGVLNVKLLPKGEAMPNCGCGVRVPVTIIPGIWTLML